MKGYGSITSKLSIIIIVVISVLFSFFNLYNYFVGRALLEEDMKKDIGNLQEHAIGEIDWMMNSAEDGPKYISNLLQNQSKDSLLIDNLLQTFIITNSYVENAFVVTGNNNTTFNSDNVVYYSRSGDCLRLLNPKLYDGFLLEKTLKKDFFTTKSASWSEPFFSKVTNSWVIRYVVPIINDSVNGNTENLGLCGVDLSINWLDSIINKSQDSSNLVFFMLSEKGNLLSWKEKYGYKDNIIKLTRDSNLPEFQSLAVKMMRGERGVSEGITGLSGKEIILSYCPIPSSSWSLGLILPYEDVYGSFKTLTRDLVAGSIIGFLLLIVSVVLILKRKMRSLRLLAESAYKIGEGDFHVELPIVRANDEISLLRTSLATMQNELDSYIKNLLKATTQREKIESELKIAHKIQMGFLKTDFDSVSVKTKNCVNLSASLTPAQSIGGDLYDFFFIDENRIAFALGDVSGKGVPAALFMSSVVTLFHSEISSETPVQDVAKRISKELERNNSDCYFVTCFVAILDVRTGILSFTNAGHNYPYLLRKGSINELCTTNGPPLGVVSDFQYSSGELDLLPGDQLVLFSDGVTEAMNYKQELYGKNRFEMMLQRLNQNILPNALVDSVLLDLHSFVKDADQSDDITVLSVRYNGVSI